MLRERMRKTSAQSNFNLTPPRDAESVLTGAESHHATICATHTAPTNIAVIKYWGKASAKANTPINSSVSVTMNQDDLKAITTIVASAAFETDRLWLNGVCVDANCAHFRRLRCTIVIACSEENIATNNRVQTVLREIRDRTRDRAASDGSIVPASVLRTWRVHIVSRNTFPTAAGLASSAAGYACLVHTLADVYGVVESFPGELSGIARQGSGSACRSMYGGFVEWTAGVHAAGDGRDSIAVQIADEAHWPELRVLIAVVSDKKKTVGSSEGMKVSVETSTLIATRAATVVPARLAAIEAAYRAKDFDTFARITMADSNQFHAICLDSFPPIRYMNDTSGRICACVHALNAAVGRTVAGYTFDAGPNAVLFTLAPDAPMVLAMLLAQFPPADDAASGFVSSPEAEAAARAAMAALPPALREAGSDVRPGVVKHVYVTTAGDGPRVVTDVPGAPLADAVTGLPFVTAAAADATLAPAL